MTEFEFLKAVEEQYAKISRFKGWCMDISERGQIELKKVILKRITQDNIDRLANIMSSNLCELYFGILTKFTEGKI